MDLPQQRPNMESVLGVPDHHSVYSGCLATSWSSTQFHPSLQDEFAYVRGLPSKLIWDATKNAFCHLDMHPYFFLLIMPSRASLMFRVYIPPPDEVQLDTIVAGELQNDSVHTPLPHGIPLPYPVAKARASAQYFSRGLGKSPARQLKDAVSRTDKAITAIYSSIPNHRPTLSATTGSSDSDPKSHRSGHRNRSMTDSVSRDLNRCAVVPRPDGKWLARTGKDPGLCKPAFRSKHIPFPSVLAGELRAPSEAAPALTKSCDKFLLPPIKEKERLAVPSYLERTLLRAQSLTAGRREPMRSRRSDGNAETESISSAGRSSVSTYRSSASSVQRRTSRRRIKLKDPTHTCHNA